MKTLVGLYDSHREMKEILSHILRLKDIDQNKIKLYSDTNSRVEGMTYADRDALRPNSITSELTDRGVPRGEAERFAKGVGAGGSLLVLTVADRIAPKVRSILEGGDVEVHKEMATPTTQKTIDAPRAQAAPRQARTNKTVEGETRIPIVEEEVRVGKREVNEGGVRVKTEVGERPVQEKVTLKEEHVDIDRKPVNKTISSREAEGMLKGGTLEIDEKHEELVVDKKARVKEEVVVKKQAGTRTETVNETERFTKVDIDRMSGRPEMKKLYVKCQPVFKKHFEKHYASDGHDWNTFENNYRFGASYAMHDDYRSMEFDRAEPHLRRNYEERHGQGTWDRVKNAVRHGYSEFRTRL